MKIRNKKEMDYISDRPFQKERLNEERLHNLGIDLSNIHIISDQKKSTDLKEKLLENRDIIEEEYNFLAKGEKIKLDHPGIDWILDNYYIIIDQIKDLIHSLSKTYLNELPQLSNGKYPNIPRIYELVHELLAHSDSYVNRSNLESFFTGYQENVNLTIGEIWMIPLSLRICLVENIKRIIKKVTYIKREYVKAENWINKVKTYYREEPEKIILSLADLVKNNFKISEIFICEIYKKLENFGLDFALSWLDFFLKSKGENIEEVIYNINQEQGEERIIVANCLTTLREISTFEWNDIIEGLSKVDKELSKDPVNIYKNMDFNTRDRYRHSIEDISKRYNIEEIDIAKKAREMALKNYEDRSKEDAKSHVGYYLIDDGKWELIKHLKKGLSLKDRIQNKFKKKIFSVYLFNIFTLTVVFTYLFQHILTKYSNPILFNARWLIYPFYIIGIFIIFSDAVEFVNHACLLTVKAKLIPKLDINAIPDESKTLVCIAMLLVDKEQVLEQIDQLEKIFLSNQENYIKFGLLTDLRDADHEINAKEQKLINFTIQEIDKLNDKYYAQYKEDIFYLFHRMRKYNKQEEKWMGWERKRGAIVDLFSAIREEKNFSNFQEIVGDKEMINKFKYAIILDMDTFLPFNTAKKMISAMEHPLNRPIFNPEKRVVTKGYCILQPILFVNANKARSRYFDIFGGDSGIDPYSTLISDVYQNVFSQGSFTGKGIYNIRCFMEAIDGRFPENHLLSHDLIEGSYARSGIVNDIKIYEDAPTSYLTDVFRKHRWTRGDWQISSWMKRKVKNAKGEKTKNDLNGLCRWKIFDNLRRSLVPFGFFLLFCLSWFSNNLLLLGITTLILIVFPLLVNVIYYILHYPRSILVKHHLSRVKKKTAKSWKVFLVKLVNLPYDSYFYLSAIIQSIWRMKISHHKLLEWKSFNETQRDKKDTLKYFFKNMWIGPLVSAIILIDFIITQRNNIWAFGWLLILWSFSPYIMYLLSKPRKLEEREIDEKDEEFLRIISRKTWRFFDIFVDQDSNWLPPDNYQEEPVTILAMRTSPTNMGLSLLANMTAYYYGYINLNNYLLRMEKSLDTMKSLERYRGHFYNWYDIESLQILNPPYISTVDSGNLVGYLITIKNGLKMISEEKIDPARMLLGLKDSIEVMMQQIIRKKYQREEDKLQKSQLLQDLENLKRVLSQPIDSYEDLSNVIEIVSSDISVLKSLPIINTEEELNWWFNSFIKNFDELEMEYSTFLSWWEHLSSIINLLLDNEYIKATSSNSSKNITEISNKERKISPREFFPKFYAKVKDNFTFKTLLEERNSLEKSSKVLKTQITQIQLSEKYSNFEETIDIFIKNYSRTCDSILYYLKKAQKIVNDCKEMSEIDFQFLINKDRGLFSIGYRVDLHQLDRGLYDFLASEARLASYVAIAQNQLEPKHWFKLNRQMVGDSSNLALVSWSGTTFEYLMPQIIMENYNSTLLDMTFHNVIKKQMEYGNKHNVPWGISECCYYLTDGEGNYQYKAFGVPDLGIKRGLKNDLVITPYASALALLIDSPKAIENLKKMYSEGFHGKFGFYESIDYTKSRLPPRKSHKIIRTFMAHHQGLILISIADILLAKNPQKFFMEDLQMNSASILLQEKIPDYVQPMEIHGIHPPEKEREELKPIIRTFNTAKTMFPQVHLLSNSDYNVMIDNGGAGYSKYKNLAITRWEEDVCTQDKGFFCYIQDLTSRRIGTPTYKPLLKESNDYKVIFASSSAEFYNSIDPIGLHSTITVSTEEDMEIRRLIIVNNSDKIRKIRVNTYLEPVLSRPEQDFAHPAFNKLFLKSSIDDEHRLITATRRSQGTDSESLIIFHTLKPHNIKPDLITYETKRENFIGRGRNQDRPALVYNNEDGSNNAGYDLDSVMSIQATFEIKQDQSIIIDLFLGVSESMEQVLDICNKYNDKYTSDRMFDLSWTSEQLLIRQLNISESDIQIYGLLASSIIYATPLYRADENTILSNKKSRDSIWALNISGDLPIILIFIKSIRNLGFIREILHAKTYLNIKGLYFDVVLINKSYGGYKQDLQEQIFSIINSEKSFDNGSDKTQRGSFFVFHWDQLSETHKTLLPSTARVVLDAANGELEDQLSNFPIQSTIPKKLERTLSYSNSYSNPNLPYRELTEFNEYGGFTPDGKEYITFVSSQLIPPRPWSNVLANRDFGTIVTETGGTYTWFQNAHEFRLTPWKNDWVTDDRGEAFYIRDDQRNKAWSLTPLPRYGSNHYICRHGLGYSVFEYSQEDIYSELWIFTDLDAPIKYIKIKIANNSEKTRYLSIYGYIELVMGDLRHNTYNHITTSVDLETGSIIARNAYNRDFKDLRPFFVVNYRKRKYTGDRLEFIGHARNLKNPQGLEMKKLSNRVGAKLDPCAALQVPIEFKPQEEKEILFILGCGRSEEHVKRLAHEFCKIPRAYESLNNIWEHWETHLNTIVLDTPDRRINNLTNNWLLYQVMSSRMWGRTSFYQSSGSFGFRDQLQDSMAAIYTDSHLVREWICLSASRQFIEGDVQHWWHPPLGKGVRTKCSDDYLWLPFVTLFYIKRTQDYSVLDEAVSYIKGRRLEEDEESYYDLPQESVVKESIYQHCKKAIRYGLKYGDHGLPLMGSGDWNDGMDRVGKDGGESVWLGFFLKIILSEFSEVAEKRDDNKFKELCIKNKDSIVKNIEKHAWDGKWFRRAFFANGKPLGSQQNDECMIDSLAQSWSVLSDFDGEKGEKALQSLYEELFFKEENMLLLLTPPFQSTKPNPGYIQNYPPGIRENGGQYTHAAIWAAMAFAKAGKNKIIGELLNTLNPINHGDSQEKIEKYKVEPYVVTADIYSHPDYLGQGGWSWYTGSGGWMYRFIIESVLGIDKRGDRLYFSPCLPLEWKEFSIHYRFFDTTYHISYNQKGSNGKISKVILDEIETEDKSIELINDAVEHQVRIIMQ